MFCRDTQMKRIEIVSKAKPEYQMRNKVWLCFLFYFVPKARVHIHTPPNKQTVALAHRKEYYFDLKDRSMHLQ